MTRALRALLFCAVALLSANCAPAAAPAPGRIAAAAPAAAHLPERLPRTAALPGVIDDLARLEGRTNPERFDVLVSILRERSIPFDVHTFANPHTGRDARQEGRNIVITIGTGERDVVLGAHYDAVRLPDGSMSPGVIDNAAGAVMLVRAAETLLAMPPTSHRIRVVLFDLEEIGLVGSDAYVRAHGGSERIAAMVNVDVAGYGSTIMKGPSSNPGNEHVYAAAALVCALQRFDCVEFPVYPRSDDRSFQSAGVPNISIGVLAPIEARQFWLALNAGAASGMAPDFVPRIMRIIHTPEDGLDKVEPAALALAHDKVVALVWRLAE